MAGQERYNHAHNPVSISGPYSAPFLDGSIVFTHTLFDIRRLAFQTRIWTCFSMQAPLMNYLVLAKESAA